MCKIVQLVGSFMNNEIEIESGAILEVMKSFYDLTNIRMALISADYREVLGYPEEYSSFCCFMRASPEKCRTCEASDRTAFEKSRTTEEPIVYKCGAGLTECVCALRHDGGVIGYIMFGQITDETQKNALREIWSGHPAEKYIDELSCKSDRELYAAMSIFRICVYYIIENHLITYKSNRFYTELDAWIDEHLADDLNASMIAEHVLISRTQLYNLFRQRYGIGVAKYISQKRLNAAKKYLTDTDLPIAEIAEKCGFYDYAYFLRCFRTEFGCSPKQYRAARA